MHHHRMGLVSLDLPRHDKIHSCPAAQLPVHSSLYIQLQGLKELTGLKPTGGEAPSSAQEFEIEISDLLKKGQDGEQVQRWIESHMQALPAEIVARSLTSAIVDFVVGRTTLKCEADRQKECVWDEGGGRREVGWVVLRVLWACVALHLLEPPCWSAPHKVDGHLVRGRTKSAKTLETFRVASRSCFVDARRYRLRTSNHILCLTCPASPHFHPILLPQPERRGVGAGREACREVCAAAEQVCQGP